ncbi:hypothetical protein ACJX0J_039896, partial [Zea mays]
MATRQPVRLVLDASLLLDPSCTREAAVVALRPGVEELLRRLRYSNLTMAICYAEGMPTNEVLYLSTLLLHPSEVASSENGIMLTKMNEKSVISNGKSGFVEKVASSHLFGSIALLAKSGNLSLIELMLEWSRASFCFYATSRVDKANECSIEVPGVLIVQRLQQLLLTLATLIKRRCGSVTIAVYGDEDKPALITYPDVALNWVATLGLGTYGAHMFRPKNPADLLYIICREWFWLVCHTASLYHLVHTAALLGAPITKRPNVFGGLLTAGIVLFSGT